RIEDESAPVAANAPVIDELIGRNARERLTAVKRGLRSILDLLEAKGGLEFALAPPPSAPVRREALAASGRAKTTRLKPPAGKNGSPSGRNGSKSARIPPTRRKR